MVIHGHLLVMSGSGKRVVGVAELKARLSEYLREARRGRTVTVLDRTTPVAQLVPVPSRDLLTVRPPEGRYPSLAAVPLPPPLPLSIDAVSLLMQDRASGR